ncbi:MAG: arginine deiminase-related protein [Bacteroidota bacterium]
MTTQCASALLMVRPRFFRSNEETQSSNSFQQSADANIEEQALAEFDHVVNRLQKQGIYIITAENDNPETPDAVFPNNWVSFHHDGRVIIYPMMAPSRRKERANKILDLVKDKFQSASIIDLTHWEEKNKFLEGTGSVVFDHQHKIAYASLSSRTHDDVLDDLCNQLGYKKFVFHAELNGQPIYHTNVVMHIGEKYAVACLECIADSKERNELRRMLAFTGHELVNITAAQMRHFAGNMLEVCNEAGKHYTLLSSNAIRSLHLPDINIIGESTELLSFDIPSIEKAGGGSIRCMMAEIFCPVKTSVG